MKRSLLLLLPALLLSALAVHAALADSSDLPRRGVVAMLADDGLAPTPAAPLARPTRQPPPDGPGYCRPSGLGVPTPPNRIAGTFSIGGQLAPPDTLITLAFDGHPGPSAYTSVAGGYFIDYAAGGQGHKPPCNNVVGSEMGIIVNGTLYNSGVHVGDLEAYLFFRYDLNVP